MDESMQQYWCCNKQTLEGLWLIKWFWSGTQRVNGALHQAKEKEKQF